MRSGIVESWVNVGQTTMKRKYAVPYLAIFFLVLSSLTPAIGATGFAACLRKAASKDLAAKVEFQRALRDFIVKDRSEFRSLADINMELQILLSQARRAKLDYLLKHDPHRINTSGRLVKFNNFDWLEEDSKKLRAESRSYRDLEHEISSLKLKNNNHPDWPKLRQYFRSHLSHSAGYKALIDRLKTRQKEVETTISRCPHN